MTSGSVEELETVVLCSTDKLEDVTSASTGDGVALVPADELELVTSGSPDGVALASVDDGVDSGSAEDELTCG